MNAILRKYDKGERRIKHVNNDPEPTFVSSGGNPKRLIGKCPSGMSETLLNDLVNEAIPSVNAQPGLPFPKKIYVVHKGAVYEAQSSDHGTSYHGYPYSGKLPSGVINSLEAMAVRKDCLKEFKAWVKRYILPHGRRL
ncbi:hypothetical protein H4W19_01485 [Pseudoxanthomonas mexicana]|uniref:Uncharacterized protein n=1 Tax=Pseudoxanthomonas mexicana TaxID=128785 RepID=A0ABX6RDB4_PSEMX|nr:hypothetical protein H4W19_01485 [Pseudoxanthomonas mexicana]